MFKDSMMDEQNEHVSAWMTGLTKSCGFQHLPDCLGENPAYLALKKAGLSVFGLCQESPGLYHVALPEGNWTIRPAEEVAGWDVLDPSGIAHARIVKHAKTPHLFCLEQS